MTSLQQTLRRRLLIALGGLLTVTGIGVYGTTSASLHRQFDATLRTKALAITLATEQENGEITVAVPEGSFAELQHPGVADVFQLWRTDGSTIFRSRALNGQDLPHLEQAAGVETFRDLTMSSGAAGRAISVSFEPHQSTEDREHHRPARVKSLALTVASDRDPLDRTLLTLGLVLLGGGVLLMFAITLVVPRVVRSELRPIERLANQVAHIDARSLGTRVEAVAVPTEVRPIAQGLNDLLGRLEQSFERERQFSGDLAHELRTPLAELRSLVELALKWPDERDPQTDRDVLAVAVHMEGIVTRLLTLLRNERGLRPSVLRPVVLETLLADSFRSFAGRADERRLRIVWSVPPKMVIETDLVLVRSIVTNLLENAVEYTPEGRQVDIGAQVTGDRFVVSVTNDTDVFSPEDLPRIFDRFWRHDRVRSGGGHHGLGLSLAQAFARTLGGDLTARLEPSSRLTLIFSGPLPPGVPPLTPTPAVEAALRPQIRVSPDA